MSKNNIIYLENYVESTAGMPSELHRILAIIKNLDERSSELSEKIQNSVDLCLAKPPQSSRKGGNDVEVAELRKSIEEDQRMLMQWAEEKMQLATVAFMLVEMHNAQLDNDLAALETEVAGIDVAAAAEPMELYPPVDEVKRERMRHRELETKQLQERQQQQERQAQLAQQARIKREQEAQAEAADLQRRRAEAEAAAAAAREAAAQMAAASQQAVPMALPAAALPPAPLRAVAPEFAVPAPRIVQKPPGKGKREREGADPLALGHASKRKAAQAAVQNLQATAAVLASGDLDVLDMLDPLGVGGPGGGDGAEPPGAPPTRFAVLPEGYKHAAEGPQAVGRLLMHADIGPSLVGRRAELFWPDDNLWYLIEIHDVDVEKQKAQIMYTTGETEELDLDEIVREGHMSLITQQIL